MPTVAMHFLTLFVFVSGIAALLVPRELYDSDIVDVDCSELTAKMLRSDKVYYCVDSGSVVIHLDYVRIPLGKLEFKNNWVQIACASVEKVPVKMTPVTSCLKFTDGNTGALSHAKLDTITFSQGVDLSVCLVNALYAKFSVGFSTSLSASLTRGVEVACYALPGDTVQILQAHEAYRLVDGKFRVLDVSGIRKKLQYGPWEKTPEALVLPPLTEYLCVTDEALLQCDRSSKMSA